MAWFANNLLPSRRRCQVFCRVPGWVTQKKRSSPPHRGFQPSLIWLSSSKKWVNTSWLCETSRKPSEKEGGTRYWDKKCDTCSESQIKSLMMWQHWFTLLCFLLTRSAASDYVVIMNQNFWPFVLLRILTPNLHQMHVCSCAPALCMCPIQRRPSIPTRCIWSAARCWTAGVTSPVKSCGN